jgi:hypothetical protein
MLRLEAGIGGSKGLFQNNNLTPSLSIHDNLLNKKKIAINLSTELI